MGKRKNKAMYGVHFLDGRKNCDQIFYTWAEEQKATFHVPHMMHGFETEAEAEAWFKTITRKDVDTHKKIVAKRKQEKEAKKNLKKYELYLEQKHSEALEHFLKKHRLTISDYIKEVIELDLMEEEE